MGAAAFFRSRRGLSALDRPFVSFVVTLDPLVLLMGDGG
jgi:hypothetical protein